MLAPGSDSVGAHGGVSGMSLVLAQELDYRVVHGWMSLVEFGVGACSGLLLLTMP